MAKPKTVVPDDATWLSTTDAEGMQAHVLGLGLGRRRLQLFVVACGDLIWDVMKPNFHVYFEALGRLAEQTATARDRTRLRVCGPVPKWLDWCLNTGRRTEELVAATADLAREVFGNPFRPVAFSPQWRTDTAVSLAKQMYEAREFGAMPILADALQDAGCDSAAVLDHCRDAAAKHVRGCWVVDLVLGKE